MALKVMKVGVQKTGNKTAAPKKSAAASMTELSEWAKEKSGDEMDSGSDADDVMKKPSSSATMKKHQQLVRKVFGGEIATKTTIS